MKAYDLGERAKQLQKLEDAADIARDRLKAIRNLNGQTGYSISINGVSVMVADMDSRTYKAKLIRGRDMLHLGALKALQAELDAAEERLSAYRNMIRAEVMA